MMILSLILILLLFGGQQQIILGDIAPPMNVQATQASVSAPVEISWSPSSSSSTLDLNVTGYRIFFDNGENILLPSIVTSVGVLVDDVMVSQQISIRSEAEQELPSELINVTVTRSGQNDGSGLNDKAAAIALGVILFFVIVLACAPVILLLLNRLNCKKQSTTTMTALRRSYYTLRKHFIFKDPNTSENVAYGSVSIKPSESTTEDFETLVIGTESDGSGQDTQPHSTYENVNYSELVD